MLLHHTLGIFARCDKVALVAARKIHTRAPGCITSNGLQSIPAFSCHPGAKGHLDLEVRRRGTAQASASPLLVQLPASFRRTPQYAPCETRGPWDSGARLAPIDGRFLLFARPMPTTNLFLTPHCSGRDLYLPYNCASSLAPPVACAAAEGKFQQCLRQLCLAPALTPP